MSKKVYGYVIINSKTGEQWGGTYASKAGASSAYNHHFNSYWSKPKHKFADQTLWVRKELVLADE
jgi:hypothetical protein